MSHLILNPSLDYEKTLECFNVIREYAPQHADEYLQAHGGTFQKLWENAENLSGMNHDHQVSMEQQAPQQKAKRDSSHSLKSSDAYNESLNAKALQQESSRPEADEPGNIKSERESSSDTPNEYKSDENDEELESQGSGNKSDDTSKGGTKTLDSKSEADQPMTPPHVRCIMGHPLTCEITDYDWICDRCGNLFDIGATVHVCHDDEYDICDQCCRKACFEQHEHDLPIPYVMSSKYIGLTTEEEAPLDAAYDDLNQKGPKPKHLAPVEEVRL